MNKELENYRNQLANNPDDIEALQRLETALIKTCDWPGLVALTADRCDGLESEDVQAAWMRLVESLEAHIPTLEDPQETSRLALVLGTLWKDRLERPDEAMLRFQRAFQLDPSHTAALEAARDIYIERENWELVLQLYSLEAQTAPTPERQADLYIAMADLCHHKLDRPVDAALCVRQALELVPNHAGAKPYAELLDSVHRDRQAQFDELMKTAEGARDPRKRVEMKLEAAELWLSEAPDDAQIEVLLKDVLTAQPRNARARALLEEFYEQNERWTDLIEYLKARAKATARKSDRLETYQRLARISGASKGPEASVAWHREVLKLNSAEETSLNFCVDYYSEAEDWLELVKVYEAALRTRHRGGNESAMLVQIAMILWKKVKDLKAAENYFKRIKLNDPRNNLMLVFYTDFYTEREDWKRLLSTLASRQNNASETAEKLRLGLEMAEVAETRLGNLEKTIDIWKSMIKLEGDQALAHDNLQRLFFKTGKWNALLELLKDDLKHTKGVEDQVTIYKEVIGIYRDQLNLPVMVINTYNQILQVDPSNVEALDALQAKYQGSARWNDLINVLARRAELANERKDQDEFVGLYRQISTLWLDKFSNPNQAIKYLEGILERRPADTATIDTLIEIYQHRKDWKALFAIYQRRLDLIEGEPQLELRVEMAQIASTRLNKPEVAIELWQQVLKADSTRVEAWQALEGLYQKSEQWSELAALYVSRSEALEGDKDQISWLKKLGGVYAHRLKDEERAANIWRQVLARNPGDFHAEGFLRDLYIRNKDWTALEGLYGERGDWEGYIRLLSTLAADSEDPIERVSLFQRMAQVCLVRLKNEAAAVECWEKILEQDSDNVDAAQTLEPYYERAKSWDALVGVYEIIYRNDAQKPVSLMVKLAGVHETCRDDPGQAYVWYARALEANPADETLLGQTAQAAAASVCWTQLVELLEKLVGSVDSVEAEVRIRRVLAETCGEQLGRRADAAAHYERIRSLVGDQPEVLSALEVLYKQLGRWDELQGIYDHQLKGTEDSAAQTKILAAIGELHETVRDDADAALEAFTQLRSLDQGNVAALRGLQRLAERREDTDALVGYVKEELKGTKDPAEAAALRFRLGQLAERQGQPEDAVEQYAGVLEHTPDHIGAIQALEQFLEGPQAPRAATVLEPYMRKSEEWSSLRRVLELQVEGSTDPSFRGPRLREVAQLRETRLSDARGAFSTWQRLLIEDREDGSVREQLERLAGELGAWDALAEHYQRLALGGDLVGDDLTTAALYSRRLATIQEERLAEFKAARTTLNTVLNEQGDDLETLSAVDRLTSRMEDWRGLVEVCERRLPLLDESAARVEALFRIGDLWEEVLDESEQAVDVYQRVLVESSENTRAVTSLERIFRNVGRYRDLADLLESRLSEASGEDRVPLGYQLAQVLEHQLNAPSDALERYADVLQITADHEPTQQAIEQLLVSRNGDDFESRSLRARGCDILESVYADRSDWRNSIHLLKIRIGDADQPSDRVSLQSRIAELYETEAQDAEAAFASYGAAFDEEYGNPEILEQLERLAGQSEDWKGLAKTLRRGLDNPEMATSLDPVIRRAMLSRVAALYENRVGDVESAIDFNLRILDDDLDDVAALGSLDRLYEVKGDLKALVEVIDRRIQLSMEPTEQAALSFRLGELYETRLDAPERAVEVYSRIRRDIDPTDLEVHIALERLYERLGDRGALVEVLTDHADQSEDDATKKRLLYWAARVHEEMLEDADAAIGVYRQITEIDPDDRVALAHLDRLYGTLERPVDLLDILERERALAQDDNERNSLDYRKGLLLRDHLGELPGALDAFKAVLARTPAHSETRVAMEGLLSEGEVRFEAGKLLAPLYENDEAWSPLRDTLQGMLPDFDTVEERVQTLERIAQIEEFKLGDANAAFESLSTAFEDSEAAVHLESELERLADQLGSHSALADLFGRVVSSVPERAVGIHLKIAALAEHRLDDAPRAIDQHRAVLDLDAENTVALDALERLYEQTSDAHALVEILERKAESTEDSAQRKSYFERIAQMQESALDDTNAAIETWRRSLAEDESDALAMNSLERLLEANERWPELADLLEHQVTVTKKVPERVEVEFRLARVYETQLGDGTRAVDMYRQILGEVPAHEGAQQSLAALFNDVEMADSVSVDRLVVAGILEPIYRAGKDHAALIPVLEAQQEALEDDPTARLSVLHEIAGLHETHLGDSSAAFDACARAFAVAPDDSVNRKDLHRLAKGTSRFTDLATHLDDAASDTADPALKVALLMELGTVEEKHRSNDERARDVYREVLEIEPGHRPAVDRLRELFGRTASWEDLVQLNLDLADQAVEPDAKKALLFKTCQLLEDVVDDSDRAIETYRAVLEIEPDNARAFKVLERFYVQGERWADLADLFNDEIRFADKAEQRADLRHRLATVLLTHLNDQDRAIETWSTVLQDDKANHKPSLEALEMLLIELQGDSEDQRQKVARILEPIYADAGRWRDWVGVMEAQLEAEPDRWQRLETLTRVAQVHERQLESPPAAFQAYARAFAEDYGNPELQVELDRLGGDLNAWQPLVDTYLNGIESFQDLDAAVGILLKIADLRDRRLSQPDAAIDCYRRVLMIDEANAEALNALERILARQGMHQDLITVLSRKADFAPNLDEKKTLLYRVCSLWEETLDEPAEAIDTYRLVFEEDPEDMRAIEALERLYERGEEWERLVAMRREKLELVEEGGARKQILYRIAKTYEDHLHDPDETIQTYRSVLEADETDEIAYKALDRLYSAEGRWGELIDLLESERDQYQASDPKRVVGLELRIADIVEHQFGHVELAIERYGDILEHSPEARPAREALERLLQQDEHRLAASRVLLPIVESGDEPEALAQLYELQLSDLDDRVERLDLLKKLARLHAGVLKQPREAFDAYARAFQEDPVDPEISEALRALADELDLHARLAEVYKAQAQSSLDGEVVRDLNRRLAQLNQEHLKDPAEAVEAWQAVLTADPFDAEALAALDALYQESQSWPELIEILRRRIEVVDEETSHDLRFRLGYLLEVVEDNPGAALEFYRAVLWDKPDHTYCREAMERLAVHLEQRLAVAEVLEPIYRDGEMWDKLAILTEMRIEMVEDPMGRAELWTQAAELNETKLNHPTAALEAIRRAFNEVPESEDVREELIRIGSAQTAWNVLVDTFEASIGRVYDIDLKVEDHLRIADWSQVKLNDGPRAIGHYQQALELDETNETALNALELVYQASDAWEPLTDVYRRRAQAAFDLDEKRKWYHRLGNLSAEKLEDIDGAVAAYEACLDIDESDATAMEALEQLHTKAEDWQSLLVILERKAESTYDGAELAAIHRWIGDLARQRMGDSERAAEAYEQVLELEPEATGVMAELRGLYSASEQWNRLQDVLVKELSNTESESRRVELLLQLGENAELRLERPDNATEYYRQVVSLDPSNPVAAGRLFSLYEADERWFDLVESLREHFVAVREEATEAERIKLLVRIANIAEARLQDADLAIETLNEVLEVDPNHAGALNVLARLHQRAGDWDKSAEILARALEYAQPGAERGESWRRLGMLYLDHLDRPDDAILALESAVEESGDAEALNALLRMARDAGSDGRVAELLQVQLSNSTGDERVAVLLEIADVKGRMGDEAAAIEALEAAHAAQPETLAISDKLLQNYIDQGRTDEAEPLLLSIINTLKSARRFKELFRYNFQMGRVAEARGDEEAALKAYTECFEYDATYVPNLLRLGSLRFRRQEWDASLRIFQTILLHQSKLDSAGRVQVFYHLGHIRVALGDPRKAKDMFNRALGLNPDHAPSREALEQL